MRKLFIIICSLEPIPYLPNGIDTEIFGSPIYEHTYRKIKDASHKIGLSVEFVRASSCELKNTVGRITPAFDDIVVFASPLTFLARSKDIEGAIDYAVKSDIGYATVGSLRSLYMTVAQGKLLEDSDISSPAHFVSRVTQSGIYCAPAYFADGEKSVPQTMLALLEKARLYREELFDYLIMSGVKIDLRDGITVSPTAELEPNVTILTGTTILGDSKILDGAIIGPNSTIVNSEIGGGSVVNSSQVIDSEIESKVEIGPYASVTDHSRILSDSKIGSFCEISSSSLGIESSIASHSALSGCEIGNNVIVGSGVVTVCFDPKGKNNICKIGDGTIIGNNASLISPIKIGRGAFVGAGSTITDDIPAGALGIAREYQSNHDGWAKRRKNNGKHF